MVKLIIMFKRVNGMTQQEFRDYRRDVHAPLLLAIPETSQLIRRFVVSYPIDVPKAPAPPYDVLVEGWFDNVDDLETFYSSENFMQKVDPDHQNFIDLTSVVRFVSEEIIVVA
jgi:uncharacterized protein (TIGR02118 family)